MKALNSNKIELLTLTYFFLFINALLYNFGMFEKIAWVTFFPHNIKIRRICFFDKNYLPFLDFQRHRDNNKFAGAICIRTKLKKKNKRDKYLMGNNLLRGCVILLSLLWPHADSPATKTRSMSLLIAKSSVFLSQCSSVSSVPMTFYMTYDCVDPWLRLSYSSWFLICCCPYLIDCNFYITCYRPLGITGPEQIWWKMWH